MFELGRIVQVAYAVDDVDAAACTFAAQVGAGPFFVRRHIGLNWAEHCGRPAVFDHSSAYGQWGHLQVELVQVHDAQPAALAHRVQRSPGIHHGAWMVPSLEAENDRLTTLGWPAVLVAETSSGSRFAFHGAREQLGHLVEIYERTERLVAFYGFVADAATDWDGADPVREI